MKLGCVFMASGHSKRFGRDKLTYPLNGLPLCAHCFAAVPKDVFNKVAVVTRDGFVARLAQSYGFISVMNPDTSDDISVTIRLGLSIMSTEMNGVMFCVADAPYLRPESIRALAEAFSRSPEKIARLSWRGREGNPVLFPSSLFPELLNLPKGESGRHVITCHRELVLPVEAREEWELMDIDRLEDLS